MAPSMPPTVPPPLPLRSPPNMAAEADANVKCNIKNKCRIKIGLLQLQAITAPRMHGFCSCLCLSWYARGDGKGQGGERSRDRWRHGWRHRAPRDGFTACPGSAPCLAPAPEPLQSQAQKSPGNYRGNMLRGLCV